uniref:CSON015478 protein n=1 Tax=Culicoides sonorensis TaxID=179676 RepID=A0A336MFV6_CULSO
MINLRPNSLNIRPETGQRTMRVTPLNLTTLEEMSPRIIDNESRITIRQSVDLRNENHQKSKMTKKYLSIVFAMCYCLFIVVLSLILFIGDTVLEIHPIAEYYCIILLIIGLLYFTFLFIRVRRHILKIQKIAKQKEDRRFEFERRLSEQTFEALKTGQPLNDNFINLPDYSDIETENHNYCFLTGRHGEFFYIKIGAAWFGLGLIIHSALILCYQVLFLISKDPGVLKCSSIATLLLEILLPIYAIFVLFFVFKYCNLIINEFQSLARFGLMHNIGTAISFWIYTIVRETTDAIYIKQSKKETYNQLFGPQMANNRINDDEEEGYPILLCPGPDVLNTIFKNFSPYLYPFVIEFCILMAGIFYMMWSNISKCPRKEDEVREPLIYGSEQFFEFHDLIPTHHTHEQGLGGAISFSDQLRNRSAHEIHNQQNNVIYLDCQGANRGVFAAMLLLVGTVVSIILLFIAVSEEKYQDMGLAINSVYEIVVLTIMLITTLFAYTQTSKLDIVHHKVSYLDDVLLFIAVPAFMSYTIFTLIPAIKNKSFLVMIAVLIELTQILVQTPWLIDGLRRCANSVENLRNKPGRALVTFLIGANITLWVFSTFSVKNVPNIDERYEFYGDVIWTILNHLTTPLMMFYRFHSSVCLVDIWKNSYEPNSH